MSSSQSRKSGGARRLRSAPPTDSNPEEGTSVQDEIRADAPRVVDGNAVTEDGEESTLADAPAANSPGEHRMETPTRQPASTQGTPAHVSVGAVPGSSESSVASPTPQELELLASGLTDWMKELAGETACPESQKLCAEHQGKRVRSTSTKSEYYRRWTAWA